MAAIALPIWVAHSPSAWDIRVYGKALESLQAGHDPYTDATTIQKQHHAGLANVGSSDDDPPYSYVYSPMTLPLLRTLGRAPLHLLIALYWGIYVFCALACIAVTVSFSTGRERTAVLYLAGVVPFFPGLLANGTILGGNVAYILYGAVLLAALIGWRTNRWLLFYVTVILASCIKAPLLSLALIPAFSARKQWPPTLATIAGGVALFASQRVLWPSLFKHYLEAVELQFSLNHDFGCSPAGLFSDILYRRGLHYSPAGTLFYAAYAIPVIATLFYLARCYLRGAFPLQQWAPVLLLGIILLNPRIMEYDVAPVTVPMALVSWRLAGAVTDSRMCRWILAALVVVFNASSLYSWQWRKEIDGPLLVALFCGGCWMLLRNAQGRENTPHWKTLDTEHAVVTAQA